MAVQFLLGPAGSGKTEHCLEGLRASERAGRAAIYLVPEQFTYSADRELLEPSDLRGLRHVRVLSFSRLAATMEERAGQSLPRVLEPAVRPMLLRAALAPLSARELGPLAALQRKPGFLAELSRFIGEVRNHGTPDFMRAIAEANAAPSTDLSSGGLPDAVREKLGALAQAFDAYQGALRELGRVDPEERLARLPSLVASRPEEWKGTAIWVDGFLSWTRRERDALVALGLAGAELTIALCLEALEPVTPAHALATSRPPMIPIARSWARLDDAFARALIPRAEPIVLRTRPRYSSPALAALEAAFLCDEAPPESDTAVASALAIQKANDPRQEVELWASRIDRWLRLDETTVRPAEVALLLRNVEPYREAIAEVFPRYRIPFFLDESRSVLAHPRVRFLLGALEVPLSSWRREAVIAWLRNPLLGSAPATIDLLENYSLALGQNFEAWYADRWEAMPLVPRDRVGPGLSARGEEPDAPESDQESAEDAPDDDPNEVEPGESSSRSEEPSLAWTEPTRLRCLRPLRALESAWGDGVSGPVALQLLREHLGPLIIGQDGEGDAAWSARVEEAMQHLLEEASACWRDLPVSMDDLARTLREGLRALRLGVTPARLDEVSVGEIRRSRLQGIRRAIVGGLNEGSFPRAVPEGPVVNERDRAGLRSLGTPLGPTAAEQQEEETYLFYIALTRASSSLLLTYPLADAMGTALTSSPLLMEVKRAVPGVVELEPPDRFDAPLETLQTAPELAESLLSRLATSSEPARELDALEAGQSRVEWEDVRREIERGRDLLGASRGIYLEEDLLEELFPGGAITASVSRLQTFAACPFQHFARSILKLEPRAEAEISPIQTGLLAHATLEAVFKRTREPDPKNAPRLIEQAMEELKGHPDFLAFQLDAASAHRWDSVGYSLTRFLELEARRLAASAFHPRYLEVPFEGANAVRLPLADGGTLMLRGRIDRVDVAERGGVLEGLVIDYKRSAKGSVVPRWRQGLDLQLAVYLLYVKQVLKWKPVGGLYVPVQPAPVSEEKVKDGDNALGIRYTGAYTSDARDAIDGGVAALKTSRCDDELKRPGELEELLAIGSEHLSAYAGTLRRGWIEPRPSREKRMLPCEHCEYLSVCRFRPGLDPERSGPREGMGLGVRPESEEDA